MANFVLGVGGCLRDDQGNWIIVFAKHVGNGSVLQAELLAIFLGLNIALQISRNSKIKIETDSSQAVNLLSSYSNSFHSLDSLIINCRYILSKLSNYKIRKIARQQNACADALAKKSLEKLPLTLFSGIPEQILHSKRNFMAPACLSPDSPPPCQTAPLHLPLASHLNDTVLDALIALIVIRPLLWSVPLLIFTLCFGIS